MHDVVAELLLRDTEFLLLKHLQRSTQLLVSMDPSTDERGEGGRGGTEGTTYNYENEL